MEKWQLKESIHHIFPVINFMPPFLITKNYLIWQVSSYLFLLTVDEKTPPLHIVKVHYIFIWGQSKEHEQCCVPLPGTT